METTKIHSQSRMTDVILNWEFEKFDSEKIELYESYRKKMKGRMGSYMEVSNILCWEFYSIPYYIVKNNFFIFIFDDGCYDAFSVIAPIGDYEDTENLEKTLNFLMDVWDSLGQKLELLQVKDWMKPYLDSLQDYGISYSYDEGESDYVFVLSELKEYIKKRSVHYEHKIEKFTNKFDPQICEYTDDDFESIIKLAEEKYCSAGNCDLCKFGCMKLFYDHAIKYANIYNGKILMFKSGGQLIAFVVLGCSSELYGLAMHSPVGGDGFTEYFYKYVVDNFTDRFETFNIDVDMGAPSLRLHKRGIGPHFLSHNYHAELIKIQK